MFRVSVSLFCRSLRLVFPNNKAARFIYTLRETNTSEGEGKAASFSLSLSLSLSRGLSLSLRVTKTSRGGVLGKEKAKFFLRVVSREREREVKRNGER